MISFQPIYSDSFIPGENYHYLRYCDLYLSLLSSDNSRFKLICYDSDQASLIRKTEKNRPDSPSFLKTVGKILVFLSYFSLVLPALAGLGSWYYRQKNRFMELEDIFRPALLGIAQVDRQKQKVIKCQSIVRRKLAQQAYQKTRAGALAIQAACRRIDYQKMRSAALTFQALFIERKFREILPQLKEARQRAAAIYQKDIHSNKNLLNYIASFLCLRDQLSLSSVDKKGRESLFQYIRLKFLEKKFNENIPYEPGVLPEVTHKMALEMGIYNRDLIDAFGGLSNLYALPVYHFEKGTQKFLTTGKSLNNFESLHSRPIMRGREDYLCRAGERLHDFTNYTLQNFVVPKSGYQSRPFIVVQYEYKLKEKIKTLTEYIYPSLKDGKWTSYSDKHSTNFRNTISQISLSQLDVEDFETFGYQRLKSLIDRKWIPSVEDDDNCELGYSLENIQGMITAQVNPDECYVKLIEEKSS